MILDLRPDVRPRPDLDEAIRTFAFALGQATLAADAAPLLGWQRQAMDELRQAAEALYTT